MVDCYPINPPRFKKGIGRPRKSRRRAEEEPRPSQIGGSQRRCGKCGVLGHNSRSCNKDIADLKRAAQAKKDAERMKHLQMRKKVGESSGGTSASSTNNEQGRNKLPVRVLLEFLL